MFNKAKFKNKIVRSRAPLRIGLAGGGTDISSYSDLYGGLVLNATIDRYAYSSIKFINRNYIEFVADDLRVSEKIYFKDIHSHVSKLKLHISVYKKFIKLFNNNKNLSIRLTTFSDAPMGSGLGASSTLVVSMVKCFCELLDLHLDDYRIAQLSYEIERIDCALSGGKQDHYAATFGGFNFIEFNNNDSVIVNQLRLKDWIISELESSLILFYTGSSRESDKIINDQFNNLNNANSKSIIHFHNLKNEAILMKESLVKGNFLGIINSMQIGWNAKKMTAKSVSNSRIDNIYSDAIKSGAFAGKISGAGGGGYFIFLAPIENKLSIYSSLEKYQGIISNVHFSQKGAESWIV